MLCAIMGLSMASFEGSYGNCTKCSQGWYRNIDDDRQASDDCVACPTNSTTLQKGNWLISQCVCSANFYDELVSGFKLVGAYADGDFISRTIHTSVNLIFACCEGCWTLSTFRRLVPVQSVRGLIDLSCNTRYRATS